mmetsp:Transcript_10192/g.17766  ORF Transcript_10192/g.17766 Transcript_10192/m.17766 type:complete len:134 (-) Transcript_10192:121-522(-)
MARRVERLMLATPLVPRSIAAIRIVCQRDNKVATDWMNRFLPMLRFSSPNLAFDFQKLAPPLAKAQVEDSTERHDVPEGLPEEPISEAARPPEEHVQLEFTDGSSQSLNLQLYVSSHQIMQRILDIDADKTTS